MLTRSKTEPSATMGTPQTARRESDTIWFVAAIGVVALFMFFHLWNLTQAPGWDPQEGYNLDLAWNLAHGRLRLFALTTGFAQHPPLYYLQLAAAIRVFGYGILAIRALTALYAVLTCAALVFVGRRLLGPGPALWGALVFTAAPLMLANTRWGYSYAQLTFLGLLCLWVTWRYTLASETDVTAQSSLRWLIGAAVLAGLCACSDYEGIAWILFVAIVVFRYDRRRTLLALGLGLAVLSAQLLICLTLAPTVFLADLGATGSRAAGGSVLAQLIEWLLNYYRFLSFDPWIVLGVLGLLLPGWSRGRGLLLVASAMLALVVLKVRTVGPSAHTVLPLLPLLALGAGELLDRGVRSLYAATVRMLSSSTTSVDSAPRWARSTAALVVCLALVSPLGMAFASDAAGLASTLPTHEDVLLATPADAQATFTYVLDHARPGDLVLASPDLAWRFDAPERQGGTPLDIAGADIEQTLAYGGQAAAFYPAGLPKGRWAYGVSLAHTRYVIVDDLVRQLAAPNQEPGMPAVLARVRTWPLVYARGQYAVYERPGDA